MGDPSDVEAGGKQPEQLQLVPLEGRQVVNHLEVTGGEEPRQRLVHDEPPAPGSPQRTNHLVQLTVLREQGGCARVRDALDEPGVDEPGEYDDTHPRELPSQLGRCGHAVAVTEAHVHHDDVGKQSAHQLQAALDAVRHADDLELWLARQRMSKGFGEDPMVVDDDQSRGYEVDLHDLSVLALDEQALTNRHRMPRALTATCASAASLAGACTPGITFRACLSRSSRARTSEPPSVGTEACELAPSRRMAKYSCWLS